MVTFSEEPTAFEDETLENECVADTLQIPSKSDIDLSSPESSGESATSDVFEFPTEHGPQYHAYKAGLYYRPNNEVPQDP